MKKTCTALSDGYHTFDELYRHRHTLLAALMWSHPEISWYSDRHHDGKTMFDLGWTGGWIIAGMHLPTGGISYHMPESYGILLAQGGVEELSQAPPWDGHTSDDVLDRLTRWID